MNGYLGSPLVFLVDTLFSLYILVVMLRFLLQWVRADFYNPVSQFVVKATGPLLRPLRRVIPGWGGVDLAAVVLMLALQMLALTVMFWLSGRQLAPLALFLASLYELIGLAFNVFIFAILIQAILSWVNPGTYNPVSGLLYSLTEPLLRPVRRYIPPISGLDLSPLVAIIGLQVLKMLIQPLPLMLLR